MGPINDSKPPWRVKQVFLIEVPTEEVAQFKAQMLLERAEEALTAQPGCLRRFGQVWRKVTSSEPMDNTQKELKGACEVLGAVLDQRAVDRRVLDAAVNEAP